MTDEALAIPPPLDDAQEDGEVGARPETIEARIVDKFGPFTGADLYALRARWRLSRARLVDAIGASRNSILRWETHDSPVPYTTRLAIAAWLNGLPPARRSPAMDEGAKPPGARKVRGRPPAPKKLPD